MSLIDIFWIFLIVISIQPLMKQSLLESARKRLLLKFEAKRGSRAIMLIHRQETMSFLGFPVYRYIDIHDSEEILRAIELTDKNTPIDLILHTPGGLVLAALQIARALKKHPAKVTVFIPHYAMSGGTLIALSADEIVMSPNAVLGPLDPQIQTFPAPSILKVVEKKDPNEIKDETIILADIAEKSIRQLENAIEELLEGKMEQSEAKKIAKKLTEGHWTHDYPITPESAKALGLNVKTEMPEEVYQLMALFPQPVRKYPTVEYIPERRGTKTEK